MRTLHLGILTWTLLSASTAAAKTTEPLKLHATLAQLPTTEPCHDRVRRVTALYRVIKVEQGSYVEPTILVVQRCPEIPRGPARTGRGDAGALRPGGAHLLTLSRLEDDAELKITDPFIDDRRPRWEALRTDRSGWSPRMVVVVKGGGGTFLKLSFDRDRVSVGRSIESDVLLEAPSVAMRHLQLELTGEQVQVARIGSARALLNGKPLGPPVKVTYRDRLTVGPYTLRVALFLDGGGED